MIFYGKQLCTLAVAIKVIFLIVNGTLYIYGVSENSTYTLNFIVANTRREVGRLGDHKWLPTALSPR